jgi:Ca-activated chloride channel family protein
MIPVGVEVPGSSVDPLRYQDPRDRTRAADTSEAAIVKIRYKQPDGNSSRLITTVVRNNSRPMSANLGFASAVAEFGMLLTASEYRGNASFAAALLRARTFRGADAEGYRAEFTRLVDLAGSLQNVRRIQEVSVR